MMKILLTAFTVLCFGLIYGQPYVTDVNSDIFLGNEQSALGQEIESHFVAAIGNKTKNSSWSIKNGSYNGINYTIKVEGKFQFTKPYEEIVLLTINQLTYFGADLQMLGRYPLEIYFMSGLFGGGGSSNFPHVEDYRSLANVGSMAYTHDGSWARVNRIVTTRSPKKQQQETMGSLLYAIGRILHEDTLGDKAYWAPSSFFNSPEQSMNGRPATEQYASQVSDYAQHSRKTFVAELFKYVVLGQEESKLPSYDAFQNEASKLALRAYYYYKGPLAIFIPR